MIVLYCAPDNILKFTTLGSYRIAYTISNEIIYTEACLIIFPKI